MRCLTCRGEGAVIDKVYGILPCNSCRLRQKNLLKPQKQAEFTSESIKEQRRTHRKDFMPAHRGGLDKAWLDRYGAKKAKQRGFSDKEIKEAKYVWDGVDEYYKEHYT